jgi:hypothetical protein
VARRAGPRRPAGRPAAAARSPGHGPGRTGGKRRRRAILRPGPANLGPAVPSGMIEETFFFLFCHSGQPEWQPGRRRGRPGDGRGGSAWQPGATAAVPRLKLAAKCSLPGQAGLAGHGSTSTSHHDHDSQRPFRDRVAGTRTRAASSESAPSGPGLAQ